MAFGFLAWFLASHRDFPVIPRLQCLDGKTLRFEVRIEVEVVEVEVEVRHKVHKVAKPLPLPPNLDLAEAESPSFQLFPLGQWRLEETQTPLKCGGPRVFLDGHLLRICPSETPCPPRKFALMKTDVLKSFR